MNKNKSRFTLDDLETSSNENINRNALREFAEGALIHSSGLVQNHDPNELPSYNFRLRLNNYQINLLRQVALLEKRSISNLIKFILMEELVKKIKI